MTVFLAIYIIYASFICTLSFSDKWNMPKCIANMHIHYTLVFTPYTPQVYFSIIFCLLLLYVYNHDLIKIIVVVVVGSMTNP